MDLNAQCEIHVWIKQDKVVEILSTSILKKCWIWGRVLQKKEIWIHGDQSTNLKFPHADNSAEIFSISQSSQAFLS